LIVADLIEAAATVSAEWSRALSAERRGDLDDAMTHLANVTTQLVGVPLQAEDIRRAAEMALDELEAITEGHKAPGEDGSATN
jgi:hypothetical protein